VKSYPTCQEWIRLVYNHFWYFDFTNQTSIFLICNDFNILYQIKLDALLAAPDALQLAQWRLLISGSQRKTVQRRALDTVLSIYSQLYDAVHNPANGYTNPNSIMPRTPDQVKNLLA